MVKITLVGDIMCEPLLLKAAKGRDEYDFHCVFENVSELFADADYVIGNLETPLAGADAGYVNRLLSFNAPDSFADAIKDSGINMALTANNHCFDRGIEGMHRTLRILDEKGIEHSGTYSAEDTRTEANYIRINDTSVAVIAYTYGTNYSANRLSLADEQEYMVNLLRPQQELYYVPGPAKKTLKKRIVGKLLSFFDEEQRYYVKRALGMQVNQAHADDSLNQMTAEPYLKKMCSDIETAKKNADVVVFCPHVGGQFNVDPGIFTEFVFQKAIEAGADAIVASHAHVVQKAEMKDNIPCFYSIGNFSMSPNSVYLLHENLPDYGLAVHLYLDNNRISRTTFSILKMMESKRQALTAYPVEDLFAKLKSEKQKELLKADVLQIYNTVTGKNIEAVPIQREYDI